jgi:hypothetical protein
MDDLKLLGLQRAEFEVAEKAQYISGKIQLGMIFVSILVIALPKELLSYGGAIINFLLTIFWQIFAYKGRRSHYIAERGRRAVMLIGGLGLNVTGKPFTDLLLQFTVSEEEGKKHEDKEYFKAYGPPSFSRLAMMLEESAFWTKHLYDKSAVYYWILFSAGLIISIVGLLLMPAISNNSSSILVAQMFCLLLTWLITGNVFTSALSYTSAARAVDDIEHRLNKAEAIDKDMFLILGDYNAIVQDAPIIPTSIYMKNCDKLNQLWLERQSSHNKS